MCSLCDKYEASTYISVSKERKIDRKNQFISPLSFVSLRKRDFVSGRLSL